MNEWQQGMPGPNFVFSLIIATLLGAAFHLIAGGNARRLVLFLVSAWVGFTLGQIAGDAFEISLFRIGDLRIVPATIGALFMILLAYVFTSGRTTRRRNRSAL